MATVASKVAARSLGRPKMNDPSGKRPRRLAASCSLLWASFSPQLFRWSDRPKFSLGYSSRGVGLKLLQLVSGLLLLFLFL